MTMAVFASSGLIHTAVAWTQACTSLPCVWVRSARDFSNTMTSSPSWMASRWPMPVNKQLQALMASWNQLCPLKGPENKEAARNLRLRYCRTVLRRTVESCSELNAHELDLVITAMQRELR